MVSHSCQTNKIMCCFDISCIECSLLSIFPLATGSICLHFCTFSKSFNRIRMCALNQSLNVQYLFDIPEVTEVVWDGVCEHLLKNYKANPNKIWFVASVGQGDKKLYIS